MGAIIRLISKRGEVGEQYKGYVIDSNSETGYKLNQNSEFNYWNYAMTGEGGEKNAFLFNSGIAECDFLWSGNNADNVYVWSTVDKSSASISIIDKFINTGKGLVEFFSGNKGDGNGHSVGYQNMSFRSA